jgi:hypothetical protein
MNEWNRVDLIMVGVKNPWHELERIGLRTTTTDEYGPVQMENRVTWKKNQGLRAGDSGNEKKKGQFGMN